MGSMSIAWKLGNEPGLTGANSGRDGDPISIQAADHAWNALERTEMGIAIVTDIPDAIMDTIKRRCHRSICRVKVLKSLADGYGLANIDVDELWWVRRYSVSKSQCIAEWPELEAKIELLFDPTFTVPTDQIPILPWAKFAKVFYDRVNEEFVSDLGA